MCSRLFSYRFQGRGQSAYAPHRLTSARRDSCRARALRPTRCALLLLLRAALEPAEPTPAAGGGLAAGGASPGLGRRLGLTPALPLDLLRRERRQEEGKEG